MPPRKCGTSSERASSVASSHALPRSVPSTPSSPDRNGFGFHDVTNLLAMSQSPYSRWSGPAGGLIPSDGCGEFLKPVVSYVFGVCFESRSCASSVRLPRVPGPPHPVDPACGGSGSLQATSPLPLPSPFLGKQTNESPGEIPGGRKSSLPISSARFYFFFSSNSTGWSENGGPKRPYNPDPLYVYKYVW